eukprot:TRINITY_DN114900_c0_g1_i1.p2 TRINITY_DN114900_c0_g1~~TRINITY_DN114900_c0_g1_i1.p2  ORF type:complete len:225 (-),score=21.47 TRINITY_DN114900_c0_g1_i1:332-928(-)
MTTGAYNTVFGLIRGIIRTRLNGNYREMTEDLRVLFDRNIRQWHLTAFHMLGMTLAVLLDMQAKGELTRAPPTLGVATLRDHMVVGYAHDQNYMISPHQTSTIWPVMLNGMEVMVLSLRKCRERSPCINCHGEFCSYLHFVRLTNPPTGLNPKGVCVEYDLCVLMEAKVAPPLQLTTGPQRTQRTLQRHRHHPYRGRN